MFHYEADIKLPTYPNIEYLAQTVELSPVLLAQPNGARFFGGQGLACPKRRSRKLRARPKTARSEGSLAKPNLCPQSLLFCFLFFGEAKKTRSPEEDEFLRSKNGTFVRRGRFNEVKTRPLQEGLFLRS
ncbi:hypothetical protein A7Q01_00635 [Eikenella sp. NML96-A-049]|nr:hypothetical protein A7Q01_00635 [Eikenella sp. NML96-A-049]